ncbi:hypothetical protein [Lutibacter sp. A80]|nr:hypothetical protein [Lutibacter sp. A80]
MLKKQLRRYTIMVDPVKINDGFNITMIPRFVLLDPQGKIL